MTDTWDTIKVEPERDRFGRYLIVPRDGGKPRSYTRATTVAETLDDRYNLEAWKQRMVALGLAQRPDLYATVASLTVDEKAKLNKVCDQAREAAAGSAGANLGTALHRFTERINRGEEVRVPAPWDADIAAYNAALKGRLLIEPHYIERIVVLEEYGIAGMFDLLALDHDANLRIADLKTGATLDFSWCAIAVQLAIYAHADTLYDPATKTHEAMPSVDQQKALVIHLPAGKATCTLYEVDIEAGWEAAQQALWVRNWRKRKNLAVPATQVGGGEPSTMPAAGTATPAVDVGGGGLDESFGLPVATPAGPTRRQELIDRIKALPDVEREELAHRWPLGVPTFKQSTAHTDEQLDAIAAMITNVDWSTVTPSEEAVAGEKVGGLVGMPAGDPHVDAVTPAPPHQPPNEGYTLDEATVEAIKATIETLDPVTLAQVNDWSVEAHKAKRPFSLSREDCRTQRRFEIMRAAIALSPYEPDVQRAALGFVMGEEVQTSVTLGAALGSLTIDEASRLALLAESLGTTVSVVYGLSGPQFDGPGLAAVA